MSETPVKRNIRILEVNDDDDNEDAICKIFGKDRFDYTHWGYGGIPQNLVINVVGFVLLLILFGFFRSIAWRRSSAAAASEDEDGATRVKVEVRHRGGKEAENSLLVDNENRNYSENISKYRHWFDLFYDPLKNSKAEAAKTTTTTTTTPEEDEANGDNAAVADDKDKDNNNNDDDEDNNANAVNDDLNENKRDGGKKRGKSMKRTRLKCGWSLLDWVKPMFTLKDADYERASGKDAVVYLKFQRYLIGYLFLVTLTSCALILPINVSGRNRDSSFKTTTIANLEKDAPAIWIHAFVGLTFLLMAVVAAHFFVTVVDEGVAEVADAAPRTLMIHGISRPHATPELIGAHLREAFPRAEVKDVQVAYDISRLISIDRQHEEAARAVKFYETRNAKSAERAQVRPHCCGSSFGACFPCCCHRVDAVGYYRMQVERLERLYREEQTNSRRNKRLGIAFVTFETEEGFREVLRSKISKSTSSVADVLAVRKWRADPAPTPENLCWENLGVSREVWWVRVVFLNLLLVLVLIFLSTPASFLTLIDEASLSRVLSGSHNAIEEAKKIDRASPSTIQVFFSQFLPTLLLWVFSAMLPTVVYYTGFLERHWTKSSFHHAVMVKCFLFLLFMLLVLPSLSFTSAEALVLFLANGDQMKGRWGCIFLPHNGSFFVNYVITATFIGTSLELVRCPDLAVHSMRFLAAKSESERHSIAQRPPMSFDFGDNYAWFLSIFTITMSYSLSCPVIAPFGLVYALLKHLVDRYNIYFAYGPSSLRRGVHITAVNFMLIGVLFVQCNTLFFQLWRSIWLQALTIFIMAGLCVSVVVVVMWRSIDACYHRHPPSPPTPSAPTPAELRTGAVDSTAAGRPTAAPRFRDLASTAPVPPARSPSITSAVRFGGSATSGFVGAAGESPFSVEAAARHRTLKEKYEGVGEEEEEEENFNAISVDVEEDEEEGKTKPDDNNDNKDDDDDDDDSEDNNDDNEDNNKDDDDNKKMSKSDRTEDE